MTDEPKKPSIVSSPIRARAEFGELLEEAARISFETGNDAYEKTLELMGIQRHTPEHDECLKAYAEYCRKRRGPGRL